MKIGDLFIVKYGVNLELNKLTICAKKDSQSVNFVSRTSKNNGVSAIVKRVKGIKPLPEGLITVATSGSVMEAFVQPEPFYSGRDLYYLKSIREMDIREKMFYCMCIRKNKYRYSYGRQANRTLKDIEIPENIPDWVYTMNIPDYSDITDSLSEKPIQKFNTKKWKEFKYSDLFDMELGRGPRLGWASENKGNTPYVTASAMNNGVSVLINHSPSHPDNVITIAKNGSVGEAFYQDKSFCSTSDVMVLNPKFSLNPHIAMFIVALIRKEKYRYNYGRKWNAERMKGSVIKLPVDHNGSPDWGFMENYIKSLKYSKNL